jgi:hypothetical protein
VLRPAAGGLIALLAACSTAATDGSDARTDAPATDRPAVRGRVWAPGLAPGLVAVGDEVPVNGAVVYLSERRPDPIPQRVYCEPCIEAPADAVVSAPDGTFAITALEPGPSWLVIQKGQFRRELRVTVGDRDVELAALDTALPSASDPLAGAWIPRIAVAAGRHDALEDLLGKIGLGEVDAMGVLSSTAGELDLYDNGRETPLPVVGTLEGLLTDLDLMRSYHVIMLPCASAEAAYSSDPAVLGNLRRYVAEGGKLYVTDWSGALVDRAFPPQVALGGTLGGQPADSVGSYDPLTLAGSLTQVGMSRTDPYDSPDARVVNADLARWLDPQRGPTPDSDDAVDLDPTHFAVPGNYNWVSALTAVPRGVDADGAPIIDTPEVWVTGSNPRLGDGVQRPLTITYEPAGCGRVMYSTYHTTGPPTGHRGLYLQERVLLYLLLEVGVCSGLPPVE